MSGIGEQAYLDMAAQLEQEIKTRNNAYAERNKCVALLAALSQAVGYKVGIKNHQGDDWEDDWRNVLFIDLPTGQVSWHLHKSEIPLFSMIGPYNGEYDGHTTEEKYARVQQLVVEIYQSRIWEHAEWVYVDEKVNRGPMIIRNGNHELGYRRSLPLTRASAPASTGQILFQVPGASGPDQSDDDGTDE